MSTTRIGVGLLGFGVVGSGLYEMLHEEGPAIEARYGVAFDVKKVLVRNPRARRAVAIPAGLLARDFGEIAADASIDVIVEVIGGESPAREYIFEALKSGKKVITANKKLMAAHGDQLIARARQSDQYFGFSAAVTGCHQLCPSIVNSVLTKSLIGIFNSTSNYILSQMEKGQSFEEALAEAQAKGYAEADPTDDVDGLDTRNKLIIISRLAFGITLKVSEIPVDGIRQVTLKDMEFARRLGYTIKLLGISRIMPDGQIDARVHAAFVSLQNPLASVKDVYNGIQLFDSLKGVQAMSAVGAGGRPTAMAIFRDLINMAQGGQIVWPTAPIRSRPVKQVKLQSTVGDFYLRMDVHNHPGVLAAISKLLAQHKININSVLQHDDHLSGASVLPLIIMCGPTQEKNLRRALDDIEALKSVQSRPFFIRVEDQMVEDGVMLRAA